MICVFVQGVLLHADDYLLSEQSIKFVFDIRPGMTVDILRFNIPTRNPTRKSIKVDFHRPKGEEISL